MPVIDVYATAGIVRGVAAWPAKVAEIPGP